MFLFYRLSSSFSAVASPQLMLMWSSRGLCCKRKAFMHHAFMPHNTKAGNAIYVYSACSAFIIVTFTTSTPYLCRHTHLHLYQLYKLYLQVCLHKWKPQNSLFVGSVCVRAHHFRWCKMINAIVAVAIYFHLNATPHFASYTNIIHQTSASSFHNCRFYKNNNNNNFASVDYHMAI